MHVGRARVRYVQAHRHLGGEELDVRPRQDRVPQAYPERSQHLVQPEPAGDGPEAHIHPHQPPGALVVAQQQVIDPRHPAVLDGDHLVIEQVAPQEQLPLAAREGTQVHPCRRQPDAAGRQALDLCPGHEVVALARARHEPGDRRVGVGADAHDQVAHPPQHFALGAAHQPAGDVR